MPPKKVSPKTSTKSLSKAQLPKGVSVSSVKKKSVLRESQKSNLRGSQAVSGPPRPILRSGEGSKLEDHRLTPMRKQSVKDNLFTGNLYPCPVCLRNFLPASLKIHKLDCKDMKGRAEPLARSPLLDRWRDTHLEPFIDTLCYLPPPPRLYEYDWQSDRAQMYQEVGIDDFEEIPILNEETSDGDPDMSDYSKVSGVFDDDQQ